MKNPDAIFYEMAACVLAAEFDIGIGSSLSFQYPPNIITHDPAHLAELMLPEGAHLHAQDYTVFVLTHQVQLLTEIWVKISNI